MYKAPGDWTLNQRIVSPEDEDELLLELEVLETLELDVLETLELDVLLCELQELLLKLEVEDDVLLADNEETELELELLSRSSSNTT